MAISCHVLRRKGFHFRSEHENFMIFLGFFICGHGLLSKPSRSAPHLETLNLYIYIYIALLAHQEFQKIFC